MTRKAISRCHAVRPEALLPRPIDRLDQLLVVPRHFLVDGLLENPPDVRIESIEVGGAGGLVLHLDFCAAVVATAELIEALARRFVWASIVILEPDFIGFKDFGGSPELREDSVLHGAKIGMLINRIVHKILGTRVAVLRLFLRDLVVAGSLTPVGLPRPRLAPVYLRPFRAAAVRSSGLARLL